MPRIDLAARRITIKLVYCGTGAAGKTSSLMWLHGHVPAREVGALTSIATRHDRTLWFDYLPIDAGRVGSYEVAVELFTVPGQPVYRDARASVLRGADGIVQVIDSRRERLDDNHEALRDVAEALAGHGVDPRALPTVLQYNKQDLPAAERLSPDELAAALNFRGIPQVATNALRGDGLVDALRALTGLVLRRLGAPGDAPRTAPAPVRTTPADDYAILPVIASSEPSPTPPAATPDVPSLR